ncbi:hypothetical protein [Micromonospora sp. CB01531]|uniref:hypothetical protein n=1 Tax=Micromonospora sp. CB01531 TaxID=1718947 RepID=UPI0009392DAA|nr:hypothetical protein [Micromonospora sp. CB01531]OKI47289.1 hypothetical protein A6A27_10605 [Micromonospora sp. CB01531]
MHPHILHALAAADSLRRALTALEASAKAAADGAVDGSRIDDVAIPSQVFGRRTALGGHGDPTAALALGAWAPGGPNPDAQLLGDLMRQLDEMAAHVPGANGQDPLARIRLHIPHMRPHIAARTTQALTHLDGQARRRLQMPPDQQPLAGECPGCRARGVLYVATCGPEAERTVVCGAGCVCVGDGCRCGMPTREAGVAHIWDHTAFAAVGVVAGNAPTGTTN